MFPFSQGACVLRGSRRTAIIYLLMANPIADASDALWNLLPDLNSLPGFFVYSFLIYLFVLFMGWLLNPTVDRIIEQEEKAAKEKDKGLKMRQQNMAQR